MHYLRRCSINLKTKNYVSKCSALSAQKTHWRCQLAKHLCVETKPGTSKVHTIEMIASDIETIGSLSQEDVTHVMKAFVRRMKKVLVEGNRVKVDGLGTFYITLKCPGVETEKDCVVKNIAKVNLRFMVDNGLRLANSSTATTRSGDNNIDFVIDSGVAGTGNTGGTTPTDPTTPGGDEDDPNG